MVRDDTTADAELLRAVGERERGAIDRLAARLIRVVSAEVGIWVARAGASGSADVADLKQDALWRLLEDDAREARRWDHERGLSLDAFARLIVRRFVWRRLSRRAPSLVEPTWFDDFGVDSVASKVETVDEIDRVLDEMELKGRDRVLFDRLILAWDAAAVVAEDVGMSLDAVKKWRSRFYVRAREIRDRQAGPRAPRPRPEGR